MRRNLRSTDSYILFFVLQRQTSGAAAGNNKTSGEQGKKVTKRYVCLLFPLEYTWTFILGETNCWFRGEEIGVYSIGWF